MTKPTRSVTFYLVVYIALLILLALTVAMSFVDIGRYANNSIAMAIACVKGVLIALFFMHLIEERWVTWVAAGAGVLWLCIMIGLTMNDYVTRNHPAHSSPKGEPVFVSER